MRTAYLSKISFVLLLLFAAIPAAASETPASSTYAEARANVLTNRLEELKAIDKSSLSKAEKKALRREVREIKKELAAISGGVYLSVGAIILIALLLILLL